MIFCYIYKPGKNEPVKKHYQNGDYMTQAIYRVREKHPDTLAAGNNWFCTIAGRNEKDFCDFLKNFDFND